MSYPKQPGYSPPVVEPTAPPPEQPVIVQQVFVVQQPGAQPVYVGDNVVSADQPPPYSQVDQQALVQQPLVPQPVVEQPQQPLPEVQGIRRRLINGDGAPESVKYCCACCICGGEICSCVCDSVYYILCCPFYVLKCIFD